MMSDLGAKLAPKCSVIGVNYVYLEHRDYLYFYMHFHMQKQVAAQIQV